jgi:hypothetical protein
MPDVLTRRLPWNDTPHPLGRHVHHDPLSRNFPARTAPVPTKPVVWPLNATRLDQGNLGDCVPNAGSQCMNTTVYYGERRKLNHGRYIDEATAIKWYSLVTAADPFPGQYPPDDTGSDGLSMAKVLTKLGWLSSYNHAFGIDHVIGALAAGPMIVGTNWLEDMFNPDPQGVVPVSGAVAGGHEYLLRAWIPAGNRFLGTLWKQDMLGFSNSWSPNWGIKGDFLMPVTKFDGLLKDQGDATVLVGSVA